MVNLFDTDFDTAMSPTMKVHFGESVTYVHRKAGVTTTFTCIGFDESPLETIDTDLGRVEKRSGELHIDLSDVADPKIGAIVTLRSIDWSVESIPDRTPNNATLILVHVTTRERARPGHKDRL